MISREQAPLSITYSDGLEGPFCFSYTAYFSFNLGSSVIDKKSANAGWVLYSGWYKQFYRKSSKTFILFSKNRLSVDFTFLYDKKNKNNSLHFFAWNWWNKMLWKGFTQYFPQLLEIWESPPHCPSNWFCFHFESTESLGEYAIWFCHKFNHNDFYLLIKFILLLPYESFPK